MSNTNPGASPFPPQPAPYSAATDPRGAPPSVSQTAAPTDAQTIKIRLSHPIQRTGGAITELTLRKPKASALRGLKIEDLYQTDVNALLVLLPRITEPALIAAEIEDMESEDLIELAGAVKGFFMSAEMKAAIAKHFGQIQTGAS